MSGGRWLYGRHSVTETLRAPGVKVLELWVQRGGDQSLARLGRERGARVRMVNREELDRVCSGPHQGCAVRVAEARQAGLEEYLAALPEQPAQREVLVALDQIQDPMNLGAVARSAACLGARGLILPERRSAPLSPAAVRASAGAVQTLAVFTVVNLAAALGKLKEKGFWVYGADASGKPAWSVEFPQRMALVIGSEGAGLRPLVAAACDDLVAVPHSGGVESLNASCAAGILLYEAARQHKGR